MEITEQELQAKIDAAIAIAVDSLKGKNTELLGKLQKRKDELERIEKEKLDAVEKAEQDRLKSEGKTEELLERVRESKDKEISDLREELDKIKISSEKATKDLRKVLVDSGLKDLFLKAGVENPHLLSAVVASNVTKATIEDDAEGNPTVMVAGKPAEEYVDSWKGTEEGKSFIVAGNSGGGAGADKGGATKDDYEVFFKEGSINLSKQSELKNVDSDRYEELKKKYDIKKSLPLMANRAY